MRPGTAPWKRNAGLGASTLGGALAGLASAPLFLLTYYVVVAAALAAGVIWREPT